MKFIKQYIDYLKDNPNGYWFKRKLYGWGWVPATWQGWLCLAIFLAYFIISETLLLSQENPSNADIWWFVIKIFLAAGILIYICYKKGEKPKWQWKGKTNEKT